jgi:hypothetical protein
LIRFLSFKLEGERCLVLTRSPHEPAVTLALTSYANHFRRVNGEDLSQTHYFLDGKHPTFNSGLPVELRVIGEIIDVRPNKAIDPVITPGLITFFVTT